MTLGSAPTSRRGSASRPVALPPPDGRLDVVPIGDVVVESGATITDVVVAVQRWGEISPRRDNVVMVEHALTGDSHITGPAGPDHPSPGWWEGIVGSGAPLDTDAYCVIATNVLGGCRGTTGPATIAPDGRAWGSRFPATTIRDQVTVERIFADVIGIDRFAAVIGGSMGGMRTLEWAVTHPDRVRAALVLATSARATAAQIGNQSVQIEMITTDPNWNGGDYYDTGRAPDNGLALARRMAHLTYRTEFELDSRFGNRSQQFEDALAGGRYAIQSYLEHQSAKLLGRFDAGTYVTLTDALNRHDVGRGRGGVEAALSGCPVPTVVGGVDTDQLYPIRLQQEMADLLPQCDGLQTMTSLYGHDGFLIEADAVADLVRRTMALSRSVS